MAKSKDRSIASTAISVTLVLAISKIFGFVRTAVIASQFESYYSDVYFTAYTYTTLVQALVTAGVVAAFIPTYTGIMSRDGKQAADRFTSKLMTFLMVAAGLLVIISILFADQIAVILGPKYTADRQALTAHHLRIMSPQLLFVPIMVIYQNYLNAHRRHSQSQLVGYPLNVISIAFAIGLGGTLGIDAMAWGTLTGTIAQVVLLWFFVRADFKFTFDLDLKDDTLRTTLKLMVPALISAAATDISTAVDKMLASGYVGGTSALDLSWRLNNLVIGTVSVAATSIIYTRLSGFATQKDMQSYKSMLRNGIMTVTAILAPIVVVACVLNVDIVRVVYQRNKFTEEAVVMTASAFLFYAPSILGNALRDIMIRSFYALGDTKTPLVNGLVSVALNVVLNLILVRFMGVGGLALATSISMFFAGGLTATRLSRRVGGLGLHTMLRDLLKTLACLVVQTVAAIGLVSVLAPVGPFVRVVAAAAGSLAVYAGLGYIIDAPGIRSGYAALARRFGKHGV